MPSTKLICTRSVNLGQNSTDAKLYPLAVTGANIPGATVGSAPIPQIIAAFIVHMALHKKPLKVNTSSTQLNIPSDDCDEG